MEEIKMFAHQVITDMESLLSTRKNKEMSGFQKRLLYSNDVIKTAHKFHMGSADVLVDTVKIGELEILFRNKQYLKLPYKTMWFDFTLAKQEKLPVSPELGECIQNTKEAILVIAVTETVWIVRPYTFSGNRWAPGFQGLLCVGSAQDEENKKTLNAMFPKGISVGDDKINFFIYDEIPDSISLEFKILIAREQSINLGFLERSIMLLNCKNIETQKIAAPKALNKKRKKSGKLPVFDYYVLNLVMPSNKKRGYQQKTDPLSHNRVHLCRGHFKEYTTAHPLFGRLTGLYWWASHVRGQNKNGVIDKDYSVKIDETIKNKMEV